jgi:hypothetical protein
MSAESSINPSPTEEEAAAIVGAVEMMWPRPVVIVEAAQAERDTSWRFSGRWWSKPVPSRRARP